MFMGKAFHEQDATRGDIRATPVCAPLDVGPRFGRDADQPLELLRWWHPILRCEGASWQSQTTIRQRSNGSWQEKRASRRSSSAGMPARRSRTRAPRSRRPRRRRARRALRHSRAMRLPHLGTPASVTATDRFQIRKQSDAPRSGVACSVSNLSTCALRPPAAGRLYRTSCSKTYDAPSS